MKKFAGVAQRRERRGASHPEVAGSNPAPRSSLAQVLSAGLQIRATDRALGAADGEAGIWRLSVDDILSRGDDIDVLAYALGWLDGEKKRRRAERN